MRNKIIVSSTHFVLGGNRFSKCFTWRFEWETGAWLKMHRFNTFSWDVSTILWKIFPTHDGIHKSEKIRWNPKKFKEMWNDVPLRVILKDKVVNFTTYQSLGSNLEVEIFFKKEGTSQKGCIEIEDRGFFVHFVLGFQETFI